MSWHAWFSAILYGMLLGSAQAQEAPIEPPTTAEVLSPAELSPLATANEHRLRGRYDEALEAYESLLKKEDLPEAERISVWLSQSRCYEETGRWEEAEETITTALVAQPKSAALLARHGELCLLRGRYAEARQLAEAGVSQDSQHVHSRLVLANSLAETGELDEAAKAFRWFIQYYNRSAPKDAETLVWVGGRVGSVCPLEPAC